MKTVSVVSSRLKSYHMEVGISLFRAKFHSNNDRLDLEVIKCSDSVEKIIYDELGST